MDDAIDFEIADKLEDDLLDKLEDDNLDGEMAIDELGDFAIMFELVVLE